MRKSLLETILNPEQLSVRFQPIFRIGDGDNHLHSVEALIRGPRGTHFESALMLFDYVHRKKEEKAVDHSCLAAICAEATKLPRHLRINVNVHAATLEQHPGFLESFRRRLHKHSLSLDRFTIEIVEYAPNCDIPELLATLAALRSEGVRIALDDVGLGQSNYRMMLDCHPEYFKLDSYFVRGLRNDSKRRAVVESVVTFGRALHTAIVAEGMESMEDIALVAEMGVEFAQCNLLCPALPLPDLMASGIIGEPALAFGAAESLAAAAR
ncbi:MAG TPA: EAL domain-containing protein [Candidatus Sulfotelmatobacter sp.]|jgi:EAL domain-containing protein (putative c-di-GMP-specific phosphodiesterase class I)